MANMTSTFELRASIHAMVDAADLDALWACQTTLQRFQRGQAASDPQGSGVGTCRSRENCRRGCRDEVRSQEDTVAQPPEDMGSAAGSVRSDDAGQSMRMLSYDTKFLRRVSRSTLIGDLYQKEDVTGQMVVDGVMSEFQNYMCEVDCLEGAHCAVGAQQLLDWGRKFQLPVQYEQALIGDNSNPQIGAVKLYCGETGVYPAINTIMRNQDETKIGFRAFVRLLHDTMSDPVRPLFRWGGTCYRWIKLSEEMLSQYEVQAYEVNNYMSYAGFTSATRTTEASWWNRVRFCTACNALIIFAQGDGGPTDISFASEYPEEAEVVYPLGQVFRKEHKLVASFEELCAIMGHPPVEDAWPAERFDLGPVNIIYLTAVDVFHELSEDLYRGGETADEAMPLFHQRLQSEIDCGRSAKLGEARALLSLAKAYRSTGRYDEATEFVKTCMDIRRTIYGEEHDEIAECIYEEAQICIEKKDYERVKLLGRQSLNMRRKFLGDRHPSTADSIVQLATRPLSNHEKLQQFWLAMSIYEEKKGQRHPKVAQCQWLIGTALHGNDDLAGALAAYEDALAIYRENLGATHPDVAKVLNNVANVYSSQKDYDRALQIFHESLDIARKAYGGGHPKAAETLCNIGNVYVQQKGYAQAISTYRDALDMYRETVGPKHPLFGSALLNMGVSYRSQGNKAAAKEKFLEAAEVKGAHFGMDSKEAVDARSRAESCSR